MWKALAVSLATENLAMRLKHLKHYLNTEFSRSSWKLKWVGFLIRDSSFVRVKMSLFYTWAILE